MTHEQFMCFLEPIEERYKPMKYTEQEMLNLYQTYSWMTSEKWEQLCGEVLATDSYRMPAEKVFKTVYADNRNAYKSLTKIHVECDDCGGYGVRMWLQRTREGLHANVARCECDNGENWPAYPEPRVVKSRADFFRWVGPHEPPMRAVMEEESKT